MVYVTNRAHVYVGLGTFKLFLCHRDSLLAEPLNDFFLLNTTKGNSLP
uniref:Uncharacterized protein n=1 Tax=uncultured gamma proteobacterium HF4000_36I10 TaxID=710989 RepID=E0XWG1_9GAMM|nr:hypothetical protein [uncultured gamma proteobacterium HF4000_36I10]